MIRLDKKSFVFGSVALFVGLIIMPPVNIESIQLVEQSVVLMENNGSFSKVWVDDDWKKYDIDTELWVEGKLRKIGTELFWKIQDGIKAVKEDEEVRGLVRVYNGTYDEPNINVWKSIEIRGNGTMGQNSTTIDRTTIKITAHNVEISNFIITNNTFVGIEIDVKQKISKKPVIIKDCKITNNFVGILVRENYYSANPFTDITHNEIFNNTDSGIELKDSSYNEISNNNIKFNGNAGIRFKKVLYKGCNNNNISNNNLQFNMFGIKIDDSNNNKIYNNNIQFNEFGISYGNSKNDRITYNNISLNIEKGFQMKVYEIANTEIHNNNIYANYEIGLHYNAPSDETLKLKGNFWGKSSGPRIFHAFIYDNFPFFLVSTKKGEIIVVTVIGNLECDDWSRDFNRP